MADRIQWRRDTAANWTSVNPILAQGEVGLETNTGKVKIGNGSSAWTALAYANFGIDTTALANALAALQNYTVPLTGPASLTVPAGTTIQFTLTAYDGYATYAVAATRGSISRVGSTITYTAPATDGSDTVTITQDSSILKTLAITVLGYGMIATPDAPPAIGSALSGGFYTGAIWDTLTTGTANLTVATGEKTLTIPATDLPIYFGQRVRLAPADNTNRQYLHGTVATRAGTQLVIAVDSVEGSGSFNGSWVVATRWKIVLAPKSSEAESVMYKNANTSSPVETQTLTNGKAATAAMIAAGDAAVYPLAHFAKLRNEQLLSGYNDWYVPALDELELVWRNLKPVTNANYLTRPSSAYLYTRDANYPMAPGVNGDNRHSDPVGAQYTTGSPAQTSVAAFQSGGAEAMTFGSTYYWCASEFSSNNAWYQYYGASNPGSQGNFNKSGGGRARLVRRLIL